MDKTLENSLARYQLLTRISSECRERLISDKTEKYATRIGFETGRKVDNRDKFINSYFNDLHQQLFENAFIELVSKFERIVFEKLSNATGLMRKTISSHYLHMNPYHLAAEKFIKDSNDVDSLNAIRGMIEGKIPQELWEKFGIVINYRHRLAHGKRFGSEISLSLEESANILDEVLNRILGQL